MNKQAKEVMGSNARKIKIQMPESVKVMMDQKMDFPEASKSEKGSKFGFKSKRKINVKK